MKTHCLPLIDATNIQIPLSESGNKFLEEALLIRTFCQENGEPLPLELIDPTVYLACTSKKLDLVFDILQKATEKQPEDLPIWAKDCIEIYLVFPVEHKKHIQFIIGTDFREEEDIPVLAVDHTWLQRKLLYEVKGSPTHSGCQIHFSIAWDQFLTQPTMGDEIGIQIVFKKKDEKGQLLMSALYPQPYTWPFPVCCGRFKISEQASTHLIDSILLFEETRFMRRLSSDSFLPIWKEIPETQPKSYAKIFTRRPDLSLQIADNDKIIKSINVPGTAQSLSTHIEIPHFESAYEIRSGTEVLVRYHPLPQPDFSHTSKKATWFRKAGWGVFIHYLYPEETSVAKWNELVDGFDVDGLASQLAEVGAGYFFLSVGQFSGHWCAPNPVYDEIVGVNPSKCSRRDLILDMAKALEKRDIRMCVYAPADGGWGDPVAREKLGWEDNWTAGWLARFKGLRLKEYQARWERVIQYWSEKWGDHVHAWWIDGCHFHETMYHEADEPNFHSFARALRAGNSNTLISFSEGTMPMLSNISEENDYISGELGGEHPICPGPIVKGIQSHVMSYLGEHWMKGEKPRFSDGFVHEYTKHWIDRGGVVTWDVPRSDKGLIPNEFMTQLKSLKGLNSAVKS